MNKTSENITTSEASPCGGGLVGAFFAILFWLLPFVCFSQTFPIYVMPTLTPPHSLVLADYAKPGAQNLVVTLMVNDATIVNLPVRLHLRIETATGIVIENIPAMNARPIYLNGGQVAVLFGSDLADNFNINNLQFRGISREEYRRTGQIPAGFYRFTVEVRHFITGRLISNQGSVRAWMALGRPPELRNPANEAEMGQIPGAPLVFSWQPAQLGIPGGSVRYLFEMWEMRVPNISPFVYAASMPVFHSETTSATALSIPPAALFLEPGMKYAWRVTAFDPSGFIPFIENGHSEVRTFVYQSRCDEITNLTINRTGRNVAVRWRGAPNHTSFFMEVENPNTDYRRRFQLFDSRFDLFNVEEGKTYNIRIQAVCGGNENNLSDFTQWHTFTIPERQTTENHCPECACDAQFENVPITNFERREVQPGDTIRLANNSTRFIIKTAEEQPNGAQRGVFLFWWEYYGIKILCEYWDLTVNTDNVILTYDFESVFNPTLLLDMDEIQNFINDLHRDISVGLTNTNIRDTIRVNTSITDIFTDGNGNVVIVDGNGNERILDDDFNRTLIVGENGEEFVVTNSGRVMGVDEFRETGGNRFKQEEANREREANAQPSVFFTKYERQRFGFDSFTEEKIGIQHKYPIMVHNYRPAFKSVESFQTDRVNTDAGQHVTFRTEWGIPAQRNNEQVTIRGDVAGSITALYAYKQLNDTTEVVAGKLNIMSFDRQTKKLYIVPVNNAQTHSAELITATLNRIYKPTITDWNVTILPSIDVDFPDGNMTHGGTSLLTVYNSDQRLVINTFGRMESDALYLFVVDNVQDRTLASIAGYMPLQRQAGFIYGRPDPEVIAHELGHGAFNLWHTFSDRDFVAPQGTTQNLMDYTDGTELWKHQWELVQSPERILLSFLQDEEEGEFFGRRREEEERLINEIIEKIRCAYARGARRVHITLPTWPANTSWTRLNIPNVDLSVKHNITSTRTREGYEIFTLYDTFQETFVAGDWLFKFADRLSIIVPHNKAVEFRNHIRNDRFIREVGTIEGMAGREPILGHALNASYCVLVELSAQSRIALINELYAQRPFSKKYENLLLNLIRATSDNSVSAEIRQAVLEKLTTPNIFARFWNGFSNRDDFVFLLAALHNQVYDERYRNTDRRLLIDDLNNVPETLRFDRFRNFDHNVVKYVWQNISGNVTLLNNGRYSFVSDNRHQRDNFMIVPSGKGTCSPPPPNHYAGACVIFPGEMVYVYIARDGLSFAEQGTILRMPAFMLAHLLNMETSALNLRVANIAFAVVTVYSGVTRFAAANIWNKFLMLHSFRTSVEAIFDADFKRYLEENHTNRGGRQLSTVLTRVEQMLAIYSSARGISQFTTGEVQLIEALFEQWGLLENDLRTSNNTRTRRAVEAMEQLKLKLEIDEVIY